MVLSHWLLWSVECFICFLIIYRPLKQFVNIYVGLLGYFLLIVWRVACIAINSTLKTFCSSGNLIAISISLNWLYIQ